MSLELELQTLRTRVGLVENRHLEVFRVEGARAFEAVDDAVPQRLFLQDAQITQTLLLADDATIVADLQIARDDEAFFLLCEARPGLSAEALLRERLGTNEVTVQPLSATHAVWSVHGPWAWELLGEALGQEIVGQPYLSLQHVAGVTCFRGGKTGEFGYDLLVPRAEVEPTITRLRELGVRYELGPLSLEALDHAALENWFFSVRFDALWPYTPVELQLQWRLWHETHAYRGASAVAQQQAGGAARRLTVLHADAPMVAQAPVMLEGERIGHVLRSARHSLGKGHVAWAMLDAPVAMAGLRVQAGDVAARTVSPPTVQNESLGIDPNKHSFRYGRRVG